MNLADYLKQEFTGSRQKGMVGVESDWLDVCTIEAPAGDIHIVDSGCVSDQKEGSIVSLRPGHYKLLVKAVVYGDEVRMARLRVVESSSDDLVLGGKIDDTGTDSGTIGAYDFKTFSRLVEENKDAAKSAFDALQSAPARFNVVEVIAAPGGRMLIVHSGFGDGTFPVYELLSRGERTGCEVVFIPTGKPYPFTVTPREEPEEDEKLYIALLEKIWDPAFAASDKGEQQAREFFDNLAPALRAALAVRVFINYVQRGNALPFLLTHPAQPFLAEEILSGFRFFGLNEYETRFRQVCDHCVELWKLSDRSERYKSWFTLNDPRKSQSAKQLWSLRDWMRGAHHLPNLKIERIVAAYATSHRSEFPDLGQT